MEVMFFSVATFNFLLVLRNLIEIALSTSDDHRTNYTSAQSVPEKLANAVGTVATGGLFTTIIMNFFKWAAGA